MVQVLRETAKRILLNLDVTMQGASQQAVKRTANMILMVIEDMEIDVTQEESLRQNASDPVVHALCELGQM